jgi:hypothetical protein
MALADLEGSGGGTFDGMPKAATANLGVPGVGFYGAGTMGAGTRRDMNHFVVDADLVVSALAVEVTLTGSETSMKVGIIAADADMQPVGSVLAEATLAVTSSGVKKTAITPVTLEPGRYLVMHQGATAGSVTLRGHRAPSVGVSPTMGTTGLIERYRYTHISGQALGNQPWTATVLSNFGQSYCVLMEYEYV